jgi:hypothetical protein
MAVANTLAYYDTATITAVKSLIVQAPGVNIISPSSRSGFHSKADPCLEGGALLSGDPYWTPLRVPHLDCKYETWMEVTNILARIATKLIMAVKVL